MRTTFALLGGAAMVLSACVTSQSTDPNAPETFIEEVPESLIELAAPRQDMTTLQIDPIDGCYVYRHVGPVETTKLPLRAKNGRPICTRADV